MEGAQHAMFIRNVYISTLKLVMKTDATKMIDYQNN